jgi:hypothetical protein
MIDTKSLGTRVPATRQLQAALFEVKAPIATLQTLQGLEFGNVCSGLNNATYG